MTLNKLREMSGSVRRLLCGLRWQVGGLIALASCAYLLAIIPQAWSVKGDRNGLWVDNQQQGLSLFRPHPGMLLSFQAGCPGNLSVQTPSGAINRSIYIGARESGTVDIKMMPDPDEGAGKPAIITLHATTEDPTYPQMQVRAENAKLSVDAYATPAPGSPEPEVPALFTARQVDIKLPCAQSENSEGTRVDLGDNIEGQTAPALALQAVLLQPLDSVGVSTSTSSLACGAKVGSWRLPFHSISMADCKDGYLLARELKVGTHVSMLLDGFAFTMRGGKPHVWPILQVLTSNPIVKQVINIVVVGMAAGVGGILLFRRPKVSQK